MRSRLEETLDELHSQLANVDELEPDERERLRAMAREIRETLDETEVNSMSLLERLRDSTRQFEESHPLIAANVGRVADLLSQLGI